MSKNKISIEVKMLNLNRELTEKEHATLMGLLLAFIQNLPEAQEPDKKLN